MEAQAGSVIIVEALSNGRWYLEETLRRGLQPVVVFPRFDVHGLYAVERERGEAFAASLGVPVVHESEDYDELLAMLAGYDARAVVAGSELGVLLTDRLAASLGVPGNPTSSSIARRDKEHMQQALANKGLRHIRGRRAGSVEQALAFAEALGTWPVVLKPLAGAATVGVCFCRNLEEVRERAEALFVSRDVFGLGNSEILVQEYIRGREFIVNCVSREGVHQLTDFWIYNKVPLGPEGNPYDYGKLITELKAGDSSIINYAYEVLSALDFAYGPSHMEVMVDDNGPVLMEVGARPMGSGITPELLEETLGHHIVDRALASYLSPEEFERAAMTPYRPRKSLMVKYLIAPASMKVSSAPAQPLLERLPSVRKVELGHALEAHCTERTVDMFSAPGYILLCHERDDVLTRDYFFIRWMESTYFTMLLEDDSEFKPTVNKERMERAIAYVIKEQEYARDSLVVLDAEAVFPRLDVPTQLVTLAGVEELAPDMRFDRMFLHCGNKVYSFAEYCAKLKRLVEHLNPGGALIATPWGMQATPYGAAGMEAILLLLGLRLEVSPHFFKGAVWGTKEEA